MQIDRLWIAVLGLLLSSKLCFAQKADWPQPRHDGQLTSIQPVAGDIKSAPSLVGEIDLERQSPAWVDVEMGANRPARRFAIVAGELRACDASGRLIWATHPLGINFSQIVAAGDLSDDGRAQLALMAGRSAEPYGAAMLVSGEDGSVIWRYDVEPMSYSWNLYVFDRAGTGGKAAGPKQLFVVMQGYPPDAKNGYCVLFAHSADKNQPRGKPDGGWYQKWRYDFSQYTCFPNVSQIDLNGDGSYDDIPIISHSRMWLMDRRDNGTVKQFLEWDTSPANHRSYGLNQFVDLNGDGRPDFLCLGYFAKHYEVLLNKDGKFSEAWHRGWDDSVTTSKVGLTWPLPPYADVDGDGKKDVVVSVFNADGKQTWEIRVHDAVTGKLKYRMPGMIAARLVNVDGSGTAEILADRSDEGADAGDSGDYTIHHPQEAVLLKADGGKLVPIWQEKSAVAIRTMGEDRGKDVSAARVQVGQEVQILHKDQAGKIVGTSDPTRVAPPEPAPALGTPEILAADFFGDGRNQLLVYRADSATIWRWKAGHFESAGQYKSSCLPVISDLNGDGKLDLILADVSKKHEPRFEAVTPALNDRVLWDVTLPPPLHAGMPAVRLAYMRAGKFTGRKQDDLYIWTAIPFMRSAVLRGDTGAPVWDKYLSSVAERYWGPSMNLASVCDFNGDGKDDLVFTNPDEYCVANGPTGDPLLGPLNQQTIFNQSSLGLYTMPVLLGDTANKTVCLVGGHYFQAALSLHAKPMWYKLPVTGEARCANEGFINIGTNDKPQWLMGFGRQNGQFACINVSDGSLRWEFDAGGSCSDVVGCDIDGDGRQEFIFGTSHGMIYAVGDDDGKPRIVWKLNTGVEESAPILTDITGDGKPQVIFAGSDARVRVFGRNIGNSMPPAPAATVNPAP